METRQVPFSLSPASVSPAEPEQSHSCNKIRFYSEGSRRSGAVTQWVQCKQNLHGVNAIFLWFVDVSMVELFLLLVCYVHFLSIEKKNSFFLCMRFDKSCHSYRQLLGIDTVHVRVFHCVMQYNSN